MASYYSTRTAYNSFLVNTVSVAADAAIAEDEYTANITQTGTMFLIDASAAGTKLDIKLPSPNYAGMYFKFVFVTQSARQVNIKLIDNTASFVGLVVQHVASGDHGVDVASSGISDRMEFTSGQRPGSCIEIVSTGTQWVAHGHHFGAAMDFRNDT